MRIRSACGKEWTATRRPCSPLQQKWGGERRNNTAKYTTTTHPGGQLKSIRIVRRRKTHIVVSI